MVVDSEEASFTFCAWSGGCCVRSKGAGGILFKLTQCGR
jgi:hypothetical protein